MKDDFDILRILSKYKFEILGATLLIFFYFLTRLPNLHILPIFADEAIYVRWSQIMKAEPTLRFLPLSDGKTPLFMWVTIPFLKIFTNPLIAGRFLSVLAGFGTLIGIFVFSRKFFGAKVAFIASLLYISLPFNFFFDRMALVDSFLNFWGIWALILTITLIKWPRLDLAMILGGVLAAAVLTKPSGWFFLLMLPFSLLIFDFKKPFISRLIKLLILWSVAAAIAWVGYNALKLGPNFQLIAIRNRDYAFTLTEALKHPAEPFFSHLRDIWGWFSILLTYPIFLASFVGAIWAIVKKDKLLIFILIWAVIPLVIQAEIAKVFTARYILFSVTPLIFLIAVFLVDVSKKFEKQYRFSFLPILILFLILPSIFIFNILTNPAKAALPREERSGYLEEWTAGYGIKEVADFVKGRAKTHKIVVGTEGFFGTLPDGLQMYTEGAPNVTVIGIGLPVSGPTNKLLNSLVDSEVYVVANDSRLTKDLDRRLELMKSYPKAIKPDGTRENLLLFQVKELE